MHREQESSDKKREKMGHFPPRLKSSMPTVSPRAYGRLGKYKGLESEGWEMKNEKNGKGT